MVNEDPNSSGASWITSGCWARAGTTFTTIKLTLTQPAIVRKILSMFLYTCFTDLIGM